MDNKKEDPNYYVFDKSEGSYKSFPKKPGVLDYVKEGFEPSSTRAMIDALRNKSKPKEG